MRAVKFIGRLFRFGQTNPQVVPQDDFKTGLQAWVDSAEPGEGESRVLAMEIIIGARRDRNTELSLEGRGLSSIPEQIAELIDLTDLNLGNNQLTTIPNSLLNPQAELHRHINLESNLISPEELISLDKLALAREATLEISIQDREAMAVAKAALNLLLITAARYPRGEARDENGSTQTVAGLLARGADVNAATRYSAYTALMLAAENGHTANVSTILSHGEIDVNAVTFFGNTALMLAARNGHTETVSALLSCEGINVNAAKSNGFTALMLAAQSGHTEIVSALLSCEVIDVNAVTFFGNTALMLAARNGHTATVSALQSHELKLTSKTLSLASYDRNSQLYQLDPAVINNIIEFASGTSALSEAEKTAVRESVEKGLKETVAYENYARAANKKLARANDSSEPRKLSLASELPVEVTESRTAGGLADLSAPSPTVKFAESNGERLSATVNVLRK